MADFQTTTLNNWNFHDQHIQTNQLESSYISAESTLIAAGPPTLPSLINAGLSSVGSLEDRALAESGIQDAPQNLQEQANDAPDVAPKLATESDVVFPVGLLENFGIGQNKQVQRIYEIGSSRSYFIPGRTLQNLQFSRVFFNGPSLMKALYAVYEDSSAISAYEANLNDVRIAYSSSTKNRPGYGQFFINLQSDLFNQPFGLAVMFRDQRSRWYGAFYCEMAYLQGHQFSVSAGSVLIVEGAQAQFDNLVPIDIAGEVGRSYLNSATVSGINTPPAFETGVGGIG